jgi:hypothetical protein
MTENRRFRFQAALVKEVPTFFAVANPGLVPIFRPSSAEEKQDGLEAIVMPTAHSQPNLSVRTKRMLPRRDDPGNHSNIPIQEIIFHISVPRVSMLI